MEHFNNQPNPEVSIHAARAGGDPQTSSAHWAGLLCFNPRRRRGGDPRAPDCTAFGPSFNPRRPRGRRPEKDISPTAIREVSIHAARAGGDPQTVFQKQFVP